MTTTLEASGGRLFPPSQLAPSWVTQFSPEKLLTLIGLFSKYDWLSVIFTPVHCAKKKKSRERGTK